MVEWGRSRRAKGGSGNLAQMNMASATRGTFLVCLGLLAAGPAAAKSRAVAESPLAVGIAAAPPQSASSKPRAKFVTARASKAARTVADWVTATGDNLELPFLIVDKINAQVFAFSADGTPRGSAAVLIGLARGDTSPAGIGDRRLAEIAPADRITPAGRFIAALGNDLGPEDIVWVDYDTGVSLHRVVRGKPTDRRLRRLTSASAGDNRITYGCINVLPQFFDGVVRPLLKGTNGMVYILPDVKPLREVFAIPS